MKYYNLAMCIALWLIGCCMWGFLWGYLVGGGFGLVVSLTSVLLFLNPAFEVVGGYWKSERTQ